MSAEQQKGGQFKSHHRHRHFKIFLIVSILSIYFVACVSLPLPIIEAQSRGIQPLRAQKSVINWPVYGQAAFGALGYGMLDSHNDTKQVPMASVAKVLTALAVMKQFPLLTGQQGSLITVTTEDTASYQRYLSGNGSVVNVQQGEQLTEYQALQAMLLPSANNIADLLARWAFGSLDNYVQFANTFARSLGLHNTVIADASGFSPLTKSTASDLVLLGENVMDNPVLAEIVGQAQANIPVAGTIYNVNLLTGHQEIVGIKTGNTDEAGGCFMVAARHVIDEKHSVTVIAVTLGAQNLDEAITSTVPLLQSIYGNFEVTTILRKGFEVGSYKPSWSNSPAEILVAHDITGVIWKPNPPRVKLTLMPLVVPIKENTDQGIASVYFGRNLVTSPLISDRVNTPTIRWLLTHPLH